MNGSIDDAFGTKSVHSDGFGERIVETHAGSYVEYDVSRFDEEVIIFFGKAQTFISDVSVEYSDFVQEGTRLLFVQSFETLATQKDTQKERLD